MGEKEAFIPPRELDPQKSHCFMAILRPNNGHDVVQMITEKWGAQDKQLIEGTNTTLLTYTDTNNQVKSPVMYAGEGVLAIVDTDVKNFLEHLNTARENIILNEGDPKLYYVRMDKFTAQDIDMDEILPPEIAA